MKDYMLIFLGADYGAKNLSPEELQNRMGKWWAWQSKMEEAGIVKGGNALKSDVRHVSGPNRVVTDRASAEIKELVGGYYIVKAENIEEATRIAQDYPDYDLDGTVEIREVMVFEQ